MARPELVPRNNETDNKITKEIPALRVALWNVATGEAITKVVRDIKLTAWKFSSQSVSGMELKKLKENSQTPWQQDPEKSTYKFLNTDVLSTIRKGYPHLKLV